MTNAFSTKFRAIGGASVLALSTGLAAAPAMAAPQPVQSVPTPAVPAAPGNVEECALVTTISPPEVICAPGTDPDGFDEDFNSIELTVEEGSQVQGEINLLDAVTVNIEGDIVSGTGRAVDVGVVSTVVNNGFVSNTTTPNSGIIRTDDRSTIVNNGVIFSSQGNLGGLEIGSDSFATNNGDIILGGVGTIGITGTGSVSPFGSDTGNIVVNSATGRIIIGDGIAGVFLGDDATVGNDGLIQTFGDGADGIIVGDDSTVTNDGTIITIGADASGIVVGNASSIANGADGEIFTSGDNAAALVAGNDATIANDGIVTTQGDNAAGILAGDNAIIANSATGGIATTGIDAPVIAVGDNAAIDNAGLLQALGDDSRGIEAGDDLTLINSGQITARDRAIDAGDDVTITNAAGADIITLGDADTIQTGDNTVIVNDGTIRNSGFDTKIIDAGDGLSVTNNGTITSDWKGVEGEADFTLVNNEGGLIFSRFDEAVEADGPGLTVTNAGEIVSPEDDAIDGGDNVTVMNSGLIQGGQNDGMELNSGFIMNSGTIESLSSDPNGSLIIGGTVPELDAAIDFDAGTDGNEDGIVYNLETGLIVGDIGINTSQGNQDSPDTNDGAQIVYNYGTITGRGANPANGGRTDAVLLGNGDDAFVKLNDGTENGAVDGQAGTDTFAFIITDTADRSFDLSLLGTQYLGFEDVRLGSQTFDFVAGSLDAPIASGVMTLTGATDQAITIVNTGVLDGTVNGTVTLVAGANEGIAPLVAITENGAIATDGDGEIGFDSRGVDGATLANGGSITTTGNDTAAVFFAENSTLTNTGAILSEGTDGVAVAGGDGTVIDNAAGASINTTGDNGFGIVVNGGGTLTNAGVISTDGPIAQAVTITGEGTVTNSGIIAARGGRAVDIGGVGSVVNLEGGTIGSRDTAAIRFNASGSTLSNAGTITTAGDGTLGLDAISVASTIVDNTGTISTEGNSTAGVYVGTDSVVTNAGAITSTGDRAIGVAAGDGSTVNVSAAGTISTEGSESHGIVLVGDATINNQGSITTTGADAFGIIANTDVTLTNSGTISSDGARAIDVGGAGDLTNLEGGSISSATGDAIRFNAGGSTLTNRGSVSGEVAVRGGDGDQTVANFGALSGTTNAVLLGDGADEFQQWTGASVTGNVDLGDGDDLFILEGANSAVSGTIAGGTGSDTAILAGVLDADNFVNFETFQLGSTLGGTLNDLVIDGNRTVAGDVVHVGAVFVDLGVDSLTATGSITLEETGSLTIGTPLDFQLAGQTVTVLQDGTGFTNNGASVTILDDDLLLDYEVVVGSLAVRVNTVNPLVGSPDRNFAAFGNALQAGMNAGTVDGDILAALNDLPDATALGTAGADVLPSLSEGMGREIFESANLASAALDRHLRGEGTGVWGQVAVRGAEQDSLSLSADGYDSDQLVFTVGADFALTDGVRLGLIASYADIETQDLRGDRIPTELNEAESIKLGGYIAVSFLDRGFINTEVSYLTGEIESRRDGFLGTIASNYDFDGLMTRSTAGYDLIADENVSVTPTIGVNAARIEFDDVTEAGGFGFTVERGDAEFLELRGGLQLGAQVSEGVSGFVSGTIIHDLVDTQRSFRLSSSQLGTFFTALPLRERDRFELAAGASIDVSETFAIDVGYLGDFNEGYQGHSARATARIAF